MSRKNSYKPSTMHLKLGKNIFEGSSMYKQRQYPIHFPTSHDNAMVTVFAPNENIHAALGIPGAPVPQGRLLTHSLCHNVFEGATPEASGAAFQAYVEALFPAAAGTSGTAPLMIKDRMTAAETQIVQVNQIQSE